MNIERGALEGNNTDSQVFKYSEPAGEAKRLNGFVQREIIGLFFESMLGSIVSCWHIVEQHEEDKTSIDKTISELTVASKKKKTSAKPTKQRRSRSKIELLNDTQSDILQHCWWSPRDEKAIIHFRNGNSYEGEISMKCMHGEGRFEWTDGTVYSGQFNDNQINGKGIIHFKDDTWYEGDFVDNFRHGKGLYVDSRNQCSYGGYWDRGTKHGAGVMYYSKTFQTLYDGEWCNNVRHGFGSREYCSMSGYKGNWNNYIREGKGFMIWPNHDIYKGEWKNNLMSGYGDYIWKAHNSNSMSLPSLCMYSGNWKCGKRNGYGLLDFGLGLGSYYKGGFKDNRKHGAGRLVTNNGLILQNKLLFVEDNFGALNYFNQDNESTDTDTKTLEPEFYTFDMCNKLELQSHIAQAFEYLDKKNKNNEIIKDYLEINENICDDLNSSSIDLNDIVEFEIDTLRKSLRYYETLLRNIYYQYATICNEEQIHFTPVLIRLYLWQLYYDCKIHDKALTLIEIDKLLYRNPEWLIKTHHNPFEEIYFWQFLHSLVSVAIHLYAKKYISNRKPNTIVTSAFRLFIEEDILPGIQQRRGRLTGGYGRFVPLKSLYNMYLSLGEQCTIRTFLCYLNDHAQKNNHDDIEDPKQLKPIDHDNAIKGRNAYIFENEMFFIGDNPSPSRDTDRPNLELASFINLPLKTIVKIFSIIFPQVCEINKIVNLNIELSFFEFFEAFVMCAEESVRLSEFNISSKNLQQQ